MVCFSFDRCVDSVIIENRVVQFRKKRYELFFSRVSVWSLSRTYLTHPSNYFRVIQDYLQCHYVCEEWGQTQETRSKVLLLAPNGSEGNKKEGRDKVLGTAKGSLAVY